MELCEWATQVFVGGVASDKLFCHVLQHCQRAKTVFLHLQCVFQQKVCLVFVLHRDNVGGCREEDQLCILFQTLVLHFFVYKFVTIFYDSCDLVLSNLRREGPAITFAPSLPAWTKDR